MSDVVKVYKGRRNVITLNLGFDVSADTITSQIRAELDSASTLIATWTVTEETDGTDGKIVLTLDDSALSSVTAKRGYMDLKRVSGGEPYAVFDEPLEVVFVPSVTA